jgi:pimeloyl-ACP methyl ester carboxylesterase
MKLTQTIHLAFLLTLAACGKEAEPPPTDAPAPAATFAAGPCRLQALDGLRRARECGVVRVAQARFAEPARRPEGLQPLDLYVEHFPGSGAEPPLVYLTGGPGVSLEAYAGLGIFAKVLEAQARGVILVEQRGNRHSLNGLSCAEGASPSSCRAALVAKGVLPEAFNSRESATDVAEVIRALGYERAVIWGHSYGSGLAQRVAQHHPERVAALILEGVSAPDGRDPYDPFEHIVTTLDAFGAWHRERCAAEAACRELYPEGLDPAREGPQLAELFQRDEQLSIPLTPALALDLPLFVGWATNGLANFQGMLLFSELAHAILRSSPSDRAPLDALIARLGGGDLERGQRALEGFIAGMSGAADTGLGRTVKNCFDQGSFASDPECAAVDAGVYGREALGFSLTTAVPTLWLQGPLDTQTPIAQADRLRGQFSSLTEALFAPCLGHFSYLDGEACADEVLQSFLTNPGAPLPRCMTQVCERKQLSMAPPAQ